jgi:transcriptional regulator with XRE-family HTH domain
MATFSAATPQEFGAHLRELREEREVSLEAIAQKTKISLQTLHAMEAGAFSRLPPAVFTRMFLRQYLALLQEDPTPYLAAFEALWKKWEASSQPFPVVPVEAVRPKTWRRWVWGTALVACAVGLLLWLQKREAQQSSLSQPTPRALLETLAPTPPPTPPPAAAAEPAPAPENLLLVESHERPCWVEWRVGEQAILRKLLGAGEKLQIEVGQQGGELLLGDAGAVNVRFGQLNLSPAGKGGEVLRLPIAPKGQAPGGTL